MTVQPNRIVVQLNLNIRGKEEKEKKTSTDSNYEMVTDSVTQLKLRFSYVTDQKQDIREAISNNKVNRLVGRNAGSVNKPQI